MTPRSLAALCLAGGLAPGPAAAEASDPQCAPWVEENPSWSSVALRAHTDAFRRCTVSEPECRRVLVRWLATRPADARRLESVALGRAVRLPWISQWIVESALASPQWDPERGAPRAGGEHSLVASFLSRPEFLARL